MNPQRHGTDTAIQTARPADIAAIRKDLEANEDSVVESPASRPAARRRAEARYSDPSLPPELRGYAASIVAQVDMEDANTACKAGNQAAFDRARASTIDWWEKAVRLDPKHRARAGTAAQLRCGTS